MNILFENKQIIAAVKPVGMPCQSDPGGDLDFLSAVGAYLGRDCYLVHRLDRGTGGVMVFAKTKESAAVLSAMFAQHQAKKEYLAATEGVPSDPKTELCDYLYHDARAGKSYAVDRARKGAKEALLRYETLGTATDEKGDFALLSVLLLTGRTHQIRAQLSAHGHPLAGDGKYGGRDNRVKGTKCSLWAYRLTLPPHPLWGGERVFCSEPPLEDPWTRFQSFRAPQSTESADFES